MSLTDNKQYMSDIQFVRSLDLPWQKLEGKTMLISGATGMVGSCLVDVIMSRNATNGLGCRVYALGRSIEKAKSRFGAYFGSKDFHFVSHDINEPFMQDFGKVDFILHLASNTHPAAYAGDPIGTITANIIGTNHLLEYAIRHGVERFLFASSVEIYGENRKDVEKFDEGYLGYIDCNTLRAGYSESKRCGEALCQAYKKEYGLDSVIPRLARVYGPTMLKSDTKASSQFILKAIAHEDIVLKSAGNQFYSYIYVMDAVSALLTVLLKGQNGEAYNIADENSDITLKEFAHFCADAVGTRVVFQIPDALEAEGYSKATIARLDNKKIRGLSWKAGTDIKSGIKKTIEALKGVQYESVD